MFDYLTMCFFSLKCNCDVIIFNGILLHVNKLKIFIINLLIKMFKIRLRVMKFHNTITWGNREYWLFINEVDPSYAAMSSSLAVYI